MLEQISNNAIAHLTGPGITSTTQAGQPTFAVDTFANFPTGAGQFRVLIDSELITVNAGQGTLTWTVAATGGFGVAGTGRGVETTTPAIHNSGAQVTQVLTVGNLTEFGRQYRASLFNSGTTPLAITASTDSPVPLDTVAYDVVGGMAIAGAFGTTGSAMGHIAIPISGYYDVSWSVKWSTFTLGAHRSAIWYNATPASLFAGGSQFNATPATYPPPSGQYMFSGNRTSDSDSGTSTGNNTIACVAGGQINLGVFNANSGSVTGAINGGETFLTAAWVGPLL